MVSDKLVDVANGFLAFAKKNATGILTGIGIAGMVSMTVIAVGVTPKAIKRIEKKKAEKKTDKLTVVETIKAAGTCYIPAIVVGGVSAGCLIGANSISMRRNAALAMAYSVSETAVKEYSNYREKIASVIGAKKEEEIKNEVVKERIEKNPPVSSEVVYTSAGNTLCYDSWSGRYFMSDIEKIRKAENDLNRMMLNEMSVTLNDFYYEIGLNGISSGEELGWHIDDGFITLSFSTQLTPKNEPCLVIDYDNRPKPYFMGYSR